MYTSRPKESHHRGKFLQESMMLWQLNGISANSVGGQWATALGCLGCRVHCLADCSSAVGYRLRPL